MNVLHIGLPKTGTTTLQNSLFGEQDHFDYIGKSNGCYPNTLRELVNRIALQDSLEYESARTEALVAQLHQVAKPVLMSDEIFSVEGGADRRLVAERLHRLFGPARVLIVVRAQPTMLQSMYLNYLRGSGERIVSFPTWLEQNYGGTGFAARYRIGLNYEPLVRTYEDLFGAENVIVLPFELMGDDSSLFATSLTNLLHLPLAAVQAGLRKVHNPRMNRRHLFSLRVQNNLPNSTNLALLGRRFLPHSVYAQVRKFVIGGPRVRHPTLPDVWKLRIAELCASGNVQIEARKKIPLRALGYPVEC